MRKTKETNNKGITLIALVITIIVMLILVGVTITMAVNGGLFENAGRASQGTNSAVQKEHELANGKITVGKTEYNSVQEYIDTVGEVVGTDPLKGTWELKKGQEIIFNFSYSQSYNVNFLLNGKTFQRIILMYDGGNHYGIEFSSDSEVVAATNDEKPLCWNNNYSLTILDTYDESAHAEVLTLLRATATKVS